MTYGKKITQQFVGLLYVGETCDIHYNMRKDGLIGADVLRDNKGSRKAIRSMCDPTSIGNIVADVSF